jgi:hypothetical protein
MEHITFGLSLDFREPDLSINTEREILEIQREKLIKWKAPYDAMERQHSYYRT